MLTLLLLQVPRRVEKNDNVATEKSPVSTTLLARMKLPEGQGVASAVPTFPNSHKYLQTVKPHVYSIYVDKQNPS